MLKNDWLEILSVVGNVAILVSGGYIMKAKKVIDDFDSYSKKVDMMEKSLDKAWEKIDKLKKLPHGGEI